MASTMIPPPYAHEFLASCGWPGAQILPIAGDASFRRYFRVVEGSRTAVLMDAPPPHEDPQPFVAVAEWLALVAVLSIAGAFVLVTFRIIHNFTESRPMALYVTTMLVDNPRRILAF